MPDEKEGRGCRTKKLVQGPFTLGPAEIVKLVCYFIMFTFVEVPVYVECCLDGFVP